MSAPAQPKDQTPSPPTDGWERHEMEQLRRLALLSFPEKLAWLEQAHRIAKRLSERREEPPAPRG